MGPGDLEIWLNHFEHHALHVSPVVGAQGLPHDSMVCQITVRRVPLTPPSAFRPTSLTGCMQGCNLTVIFPQRSSAARQHAETASSSALRGAIKSMS